MKKLLIIVLFFSLTTFAFAQNSNPEYVGKYKFDGAPFANIIISVEGSTIYAEAEGVGKGEVFASKNKDEYTEPNNDAILVFNRDASGMVVSLTVKVQGSELKGAKELDNNAKYLGKYKFADDSAIPEIIISIKDGGLYGETEQGSASLKVTATKDIFEVVGYEGTVEFVNDSTGNISNIILVIQGMRMKGEKK